MKKINIHVICENVLFILYLLYVNIYAVINII